MNYKKILTHSTLSWKIHTPYCQACYRDFSVVKEEGKERTIKQALVFPPLLPGNTLKKKIIPPLSMVSVFQTIK